MHFKLLIPGYFRIQNIRQLLNRCGKIALLLLLLSFISKFSYGLTVDKILATVGEEVVTLADYHHFVKTAGVERSDTVDETLLRTLLEEMIILREARLKGIEVSDQEVEEGISILRENNDISQEELEAILREEGISADDYRKRIKEDIILAKFIDMEVNSKIFVSEKEIEEFYNKNIRDYINEPETVELKAIFIRLYGEESVTELTDLKRKVLKIRSLLGNGEDFTELVEKYSDEPLKSQNGNLGIFTKGTLLSPLDEEAFSLEIGQISEPLWANEGVYILKLMNRNSESYKPLQEVKSEIQRHLFKQKRERLYNEWVKNLWEKTSVIIN